MGEAAAQDVQDEAPPGKEGQVAGDMLLQSPEGLEDGGNFGDYEGAARSLSASRIDYASARSPMFSAKTSSTMHLASPELSQVNLFEDMERLRRIMECMESAMPSDVRQNISFFKSRFNTPATIEGGHSISRDTGHSWNTNTDLESHVLELKNEAEDVGMRMK